jgi:SOS-response transcriptional repressor LexA
MASISRERDELNVLAFILGFQHLYNGCGSPSIREIVDACGFSSTSVAHAVLRRMEKKGRIVLHGQRMIEVVRGGCTCDMESKAEASPASASSAMKPAELSLVSVMNHGRSLLSTLQGSTCTHSRIEIEN